MTIAVNTRFYYSEKPVDFVQFIINCISDLAHTYPEHHFILIAENPMNTRFTSGGNIEEVIIRPRLNRILWYNFLLPTVLKRYKTDILVNVGDIFSAAVRIPQCTLVHEKVILPGSHSVPKNMMRFYRKQLHGLLPKACSVLTLSEYTKSCLIKNFNIAGEKIDVLNPVACSIFTPVDETTKENTRSHYADGKEYFLYTGPLQLFYEQMNLFKAFSVFKKRQKSNMMLLIAGQQQNADELKKNLSTFKYRDAVKLTGALEPEGFAKLTASAYAIVYPVTSGDFPFRLTEALQCGVPIITSPAANISELCGDAAIYCDPVSFTDIADKMMYLFKDENKKKELGEKGPGRILTFTREKTAESFWRSILKCSLPVN